ncbi:MAG: hypothetical protein K8S21_02515 [Gemmatimonadetes bacterium]|nr:hypothetical protein [Gemmatimonadota bacterium]
MKGSLRKSVLVLAALAASSLSCGREVTGPGGGVRWAAGLALAPQFPAGFVGPSGVSVVAFARVRIVFRRSDGTIALDKSIDFPSDADSVPLTLAVPLSGTASETGEPMTLTMYYVDAAGDTVFTGGPVSLVVKQTKAGDPAPPPVLVPIRYTGPGSTATRVAITPKTLTLFPGDPAQFGAQAFDAQNAVIAGTPVGFSSADTTLVRVGANGAGTAQPKRGTTLVIASLLTGQADTATVTVELRAALIGGAGGNGQSGEAGGTLPVPVSVRVLAADSVPVAGVAVTFAATAGGVPGATTVASDANGIASTVWTLGGTVGAQTMSASAAGLSGSPVTFTATATQGPATQLVVTSQPAASVAGVPISPAVVVAARTALGLPAATFADSVTIAVATNPGGATLGGTRTVAAVNGVATFADLSLDKAGAGYTLAASAAGLSPATTTGFGITPAAASALVFSVQPAGGTPGGTLAPSPRATAVDAFGNLTTFAGTVTLALGANPGGATLTGTTSVTAVNGVATWTNVQVSAPGIGYTFVASAAGLSNATSDPFSIGTGVLSWVNASGGNWSNAANWDQNRVPTASDVVAISLSGTYTVTLDVNPNVASLQVGGASGTQTLAMNGRTLALGGSMLVGANGAVSATNSAITGAGALTNTGLVTLVATTIAVPLENRALLIASGASAIGGALTTTPASIVRVGQVDGSNSVATLTVANGFTNTGTIELTVIFNAAYSSQLAVTTGSLVNAPGATLAALPGTTGGGTRTLAAQLDNQGTLALAVPLSINRAGAAHLNSGTIDLTSGDLTLTQSGVGASFTNVGDITVGAGRSLVVNGGTFATNGGSVSGAGTFSASGASIGLGVGIGSAIGAVVLANSTVNGPGTLTSAAGSTMTLVASTVNSPLDNLGIINASGASAINGAFANPAGSLLRVGQVDGSNSVANLAFAAGFTNGGAIELTVLFNAAYSAQLGVTNGSLVNAPGATISALPGTAGGGTRTLAAQLDNQGTLSLVAPLSINRAGAVHSNSGSIDVSVADLTLTQSGTTPSFTNTGAITLAAGRTLAVSGGALNLDGGTVSGAGTLGLSGVSLTLGVAFSNAVTSLNFSNSTVSGPGSLVNATGRAMTMVASTVNAPFVNQGALTVSGASAITGAFSNQAGALLRVGQVDGSNSVANLTVANGFTNLGAIELSVVFNAAYSSQLTVTAGSLVNAPGATIAALPGTVGGGTRTLAAQLDNQGTITAEVPLAINRAGAAHANSGTMDFTVANATITQSGTTPSFTNTGTITVGAGRSLAVSGGTFNQTGTFAGTGTLGLYAMTLNLGASFSNAVTSLAVGNSTINGPGVLTNAAGRTLTLIASTVTAAVDNQGTLVSSGSTSITGALTTNAGSVLRVGQVDGSNSVANLTVANGFTNVGAIELTVIFNAAYSAQLTVTSGSLVNAPGATITSLGGTAPGGARTLAAQLDNQGTLTTAVAMSLNRASAAHLNAGTVDLTGGNLTVTQSGTTPSFTNAGAVTIGAGRTFAVSGGAFTSQAGATIGGAGLAFASATASFNGATPAVTSFSLTNTTATFANPVTSASTAFTLSNATLNGPGPFTNAVGQTLTVNGSDINMPVDNQGTVIGSGASTITGALTTSVGSVLRVGQVDGSSGLANLTVANGFTNNGAIELTVTFNAAYGAQLTVASGTLVNAPGATIASLGGTAPGGARTLAAQLDNQGTLTTAVAMSLNRASAAHLNAGTVDLTGGNLTVTQSGTAPTFTNAGALTIGAGRTLTVSGGTLTGQPSGTIDGATLGLSGTTAFFDGPAPAVSTFSSTNSTLTFANAVSTAGTAYTFSNSVITGNGGTFTNAAGQTLALEGVDMLAPFTNAGTVTVSGSSSFNAITTTPTSVIRVAQSSGSSGIATLDASTGFTNNGLIEISNAFVSAYNAQITVQAGGTLLNAAGATIDVLGGQTPGGTRAINALVNNQGTITVRAGAAQRLNIVGSLASTGTINMEIGGLTADSQYDRIVITGTPSSAVLGGTLNVSLINGFVPTSLNSFGLITTGTGPLSGTFALPNLLGFTATPTYTGSGFSLVVP